MIRAIKTNLFLYLILASIIAATSASSTYAQKTFIQYDRDLPLVSNYKTRRAEAIKHLGQRSAVVILAADVRNRQNDVDYEYRQNSDLLYLTGFPFPQSALLLVPGGYDIAGEKVTEILFVKARNTMQEKWTGAEMGIEETKSLLNFKHVLSIDELDEVIKTILPSIDTLFVPNLPTKTVSMPMVGRRLGMLGELTHDINDIRNSGVTGAELSIKTTWPPLAYMREVKDADELRLMQRAIDISIEGHKASMMGAKPGMKEYEIEALMEYTFKRMGAEDVGYPSIVGSNYNACILHYTANRRPTISEELVLADCGAEYHGYTADITRTFPVSGTFSKEQRIIYDIVLEAQDSGIAASNVGASFKAANTAAKTVIARRLQEIGITHDSASVSTYFTHGTSHYLGLDVHDAGTYGPLRENCVITVEPGIYIPADSPCDKKWWNIGVRIEDDILITSAGPVNMSAALPRTAVDVEKLVQSGKGTPSR